jgi:hypothetical protein
MSPRPVLTDDKPPRSIALTTTGTTIKFFAAASH